MATQTLAERSETLRPTGLSPLLNTAQLMARYGVSNWTVNEWVKKGCPVEPTSFRGRRFDLDAVRTWMAAQPEAAPIPAQRTA
ncbi:helix-turn-helix transcriptional regulator [Streptomyces sp. NPDC058469]|uniref:helix-turn-helix transcriptional regulator n=1 Tax=Streptomyces sp. NPDC058469 TaxID=3346514 RepID=UPI0036541267